MLTYEDAYGADALDSDPIQTEQPSPVVVQQVAGVEETTVLPGELPEEICPEGSSTEVCLIETEAQVSNALESSVALEELKEVVEANITNESFDAAHSRLLTFAIKGMLAGQKIENLDSLNLESAVVLANTYENNLNIIKEIELNLEASIVSGLLKAYTAIREEFSAVHRGYGAMQFRSKNAGIKLKKVVGTGKANINFRSVHRLSINGNTDTESIIAGLKASVKMANELVSIYYPSIYQLIDTVTQAVEDTISPKGEKLSSDQKRRIAIEASRKVNDIYNKIVNFADVGVVSGEAYLEANSASAAGSDFKPIIKFEIGDRPDARANLEISKNDAAQIIALTDQLLEATNKIYAAHSGFYNRTVRRYEEFREAYRTNASLLRKIFDPAPLLLTYITYLAGTNGAIYVPIHMYQHFFRVTRASTLLLDKYFARQGIDN